jgi:AraC family transcriptional regulator
MTSSVYSKVDGDDAGILHRDVLAELIIQASSLFETDRCKAKRCIERAAELVRRKRSMQSSASGRIVIRGGLTTLQAKQLATYIDANIGARIPCSELAALARISVGHLFRAFRVSFGASPQAYIMRRRIQHAEMLMLRTNEPLAGIAVNCGLCDQAHFSHAFRRLVGVTPNVWRREHGSASSLATHSWSQAPVHPATARLSESPSAWRATSL